MEIKEILLSKRNYFDILNKSNNLGFDGICQKNEERFYEEHSTL